MQRFRRLFALLFILSIFVGVVHEINHNYHDGDTCELCILIHAPGVLTDTSCVALIEPFYTPFTAPNSLLPLTCFIQTRSRSPPLS